MGIPKISESEAEKMANGARLAQAGHRGTDFMHHVFVSMAKHKRRASGIPSVHITKKTPNLY